MAKSYPKSWPYRSYCGSRVLPPFPHTATATTSSTDQTDVIQQGQAKGEPNVFMAVDIDLWVDCVHVNRGDSGCPTLFSFLPRLTFVTFFSLFEPLKFPSCLRSS